MLTVQELEALANALTRSPSCKEVQINACRALRGIADQMRRSEPVAWRFRPPKLETWAITQYAFDPIEVKLSKCIVEPLYITPLADAEDARRYRWLRNEAGETFDGPYISGKRNAPFAGEGWLTDEHADDVIDAAMKEDSHDH